MSITYYQITDGSEQVDLSQYRPFKAIIIDEIGTSNAVRAQISKWMIESGCFYAMTWGCDCSLWHDALDDEASNFYGFDDDSDKSFVVTTWHEDESLENVFWFSAQCADHPAYKLNSTLIIHVSNTDNAAHFTALAQRAKDFPNDPIFNEN